MPSPVGHALGGVLFGWLADGVPGAGAPASASVRRAGEDGRFWADVRRALSAPRSLAFLALGPLADIDFLFGIHSRQTHSIGATLVVLFLAWAWAMRRRPVTSGRPAAASGQWRFAVACACAYGSHVLFDWMGDDTTPPIGIMALWPLSDAFYQSNLFVFAAISRRWWLAGFWTHNLLAVVREIAIVLPPVLLVAWWRWRRDANLPTGGR